MDLGIDEWRALAMGWAAAIIAAFYFTPITWPVPAIAIVVTVTTRMLWRS